MIASSLDQLTHERLQQLCDDRSSESQTLEFKRDLPGSSDKDKHELCKDVCALANADGGDIVYGIEESNSTASALAPISVEQPDSALRRLSQTLDAGIEPRVQGLKLRQVSLPNGYALVIRVPASFDGPHCVRTNLSRRFVMRNGASATDMSFDQVRAAFDRTATLSDRGRRFVADRLLQIAARTNAAPMSKGPIWALHLVPIAGIAGRQGVNLREINAKSWVDFFNPDWGSAGRTFNFDGLLIHPGGATDEGFYTYSQIFRSGVLEGARLAGAKREVDAGKEASIVWSLDMSHFFHGTLRQFASAIRSWGLAGPALLSAAILDVKGFELGIGGTFHRFGRATADRPHLIPPDVWIEDVESFDADRTLGPLMDTFWQAFGQDRCPDFDERTGAFAPRRS